MGPVRAVIGGTLLLGAFGYGVLTATYRIFPYPLLNAIRQRVASRGALAHGERVFSASCESCHGPRGSGGFGPPLDRVGVLDDAVFRRVIREGAPRGMPAIPLSDSDIAAVLQYLRRLPQEASATTRVGDPKRGAQLVAHQGCRRCHTLEGAGGHLGPRLDGIAGARGVAHLRTALVDPRAAIEPQYRGVRLVDAAGKTYVGVLLNEDADWIQIRTESDQLLSFEKARLRSVEAMTDSLMPTYKEALTAAEIEDVVAYLMELTPQGPGR